MNAEQAQKVLLAYRLGESTEGAPQLEEALEMAANDPALGAWLEQELALDRAIRARLQQVQPPVGLRERIQSRARIVPVPWWRHSRALAAAAAVIICAAGLGALQLIRGPRDGGRSVVGAVGRRPAVAGWEEFRAAMIGRLSRGEYRLELNTPEFAEVKRHLARRGSNAAQLAPAPLAGLSTYGCEVFQWQGARVTLICFQSPQLGIAHLLVIDASALTGFPEATRTFAEVDSWASAGWRDGDQVVLVCSPADLGDLRRVLTG